MTDSVPEKLGKYKIIEEVGRGGFAAVYKAVDTTLDRTVALKVLAPHLLWDPTFVQRFQREAKVAANLDHSNIVTIHEVGQIEGVYFIAMQFLEGQTLSQVLEAEGPLPVSRVQSIIEQLASALDYAHARDFVHRDIKPSNVIVADDGRATLTDFGLVKAGEGTKLSTTGVVFGTPEYMSPEQAEGVEELDVRSDVYSLGVVLFEMLAGRAPFVADTTPAVMYKHVHEPPPLDELPSDLPQGVVTVVERALAKKREERYQSAGEMAVALRQAVSGVVVEAERMLPPSVPARPALPWKWVAGVGAAVVVVVTLIIALVSGGGPAAKPTSTPTAAALAPTATPTTVSTKTPTPVPLTGPTSTTPAPPYYMLQLLTNCGPDWQFIGLLTEGQWACDPAVPHRDISWLESQLRQTDLLSGDEGLRIAPDRCTTNCRLDIVRGADNFRLGSIRLDTTAGFPGEVYRVNGRESAHWRLRGDFTWEIMR